MLQEEVSLSLTTPVLRDADSLFPGENWFFYWKTSSSLWKTKLEEYTQSNRIIVPINWAFHSEDGENYDFADKRPETDLAKLVRSAKECHKQIVFLLPLGPAPFLPNGGLPALLSRTISIGPDGFPYSILDPDGNMHKIFSYFDNRVYASFRNFLRKLSEYFSQNGIDSDLWGVDCGYVGEEGFQSFFFDRSKVYEQAFTRFLSSQKEEEADPEKAKLFEEGVLTPEKEHQLHVRFYHSLREIYIREAEESMASNWEGMFRVGFLGTSPGRFFERINDRDGIHKYAYEVLESMSLDVLPSSVCLNSRLKRGVLGKMLEELVSKSYSPSKVKPSYYDEEDPTYLNPLSFFEVFDLHEEADPQAANWADLGLWEFLQKRYSWCFSDQGEVEYYWDESRQNEEKIFFFHGLDMNKKLFHNILKTFMSGGKVVLNRSGLANEYLKRLESFFLENNLKVEKVNFFTTLHNVFLGEGRLVIFEGDKLADLSDSDCEHFWSRLFSTFKINHLSLPYEEGIYFTWRVRAATHNELNYEEIRRMGVYNPTSYKKKIRFAFPHHFNLVKIVDETNVKIKTHPHEVELELLPEGSVSFDFGVFTP